MVVEIICTRHLLTAARQSRLNYTMILTSNSLCLCSKSILLYAMMCTLCCLCTLTVSSVSVRILNCSGKTFQDNTRKYLSCIAYSSMQCMRLYLLLSFCLLIIRRPSDSGANTKVASGIRRMLYLSTPRTYPLLPTV